jgi:hypothetical protein
VAGFFSSYQFRRGVARPFGLEIAEEIYIGEMMQFVYNNVGP